MQQVSGYRNIAVEMMGLQLDQVKVSLGDISLLESAGSGASWGGNSSISGVYASVHGTPSKLAGLTGFAGTPKFADSCISWEESRVPLRELAIGCAIVAEGGIQFGDFVKGFAQASFGAHFYKVGVDVYTSEMRVNRMLLVAEIGRVLNPKTARSQCICV